MLTKVYKENLNGIDCEGEMGADKRIILKYILKKWNVIVKLSLCLTD
jgi:hypothetical protein